MGMLFTSKLSDYIQGNRISTAMDGGGSAQQRCFCTAKTRVQKLTRRSIFELGTDAAGSRKKQVCRANLQLKNVHGCTFLSDGTDVRGTPQKRMYFTLP